MPPYSHDPYAPVIPDECAPRRRCSPPPYGGGASARSGPVPFLRFAGWADPPRETEEEGLVRLFIGQLPRTVTGGQLQELCAALVPGAELCTVQHILKWRTGDCQGCVHAQCRPADAHRIVAALHERVLFEHDGAWCATSSHDAAALRSFSDELRARRLRPRDLPAGRVVVQMATSTFVPHGVRL